jgi:hypothetical protein
MMHRGCAKKDLGTTAIRAISPGPGGTLGFRRISLKT